MDSHCRFSLRIIARRPLHGANCTIGLPSCGQRLARLPVRNGSPTSIIGGPSPYFRLQEPVLDNSEMDSHCRFSLRIIARRPLHARWENPLETQSWSNVCVVKSRYGMDAALTAGIQERIV